MLEVVTWPNSTAESQHSREIPPETRGIGGPPIGVSDCVLPSEALAITLDFVPPLSLVFHKMLQHDKRFTS
jgi:hypothetical protein